METSENCKLDIAGAESATTTSTAAVANTDETLSEDKSESLSVEAESSEEPPRKLRKSTDVSEIDKAVSNAADESQQDAVVSSTVGLRRFKRIPIFIVDYHNDVLEFIYRCLASRHLPLENNTLLHFDSHPDMVIPRDIPASYAFHKETMLSELSIENWIMPACYAGHFDRVIWVKNSWCLQMPQGKYNFKVGQKDDRICVDCTLDYFISEGNYCQTSDLEQTRDIELRVADNDTENGPDPKELLGSGDGHNFILDIDLDFFSTSNPFLEIYKDANCYEQLRQIFHFESGTEANATATTEKRKLQLEALKAMFEYLEENRSLEDIERPDVKVISQDVYDKIAGLADSLQKCYADEEIDWLLIFDSGSTTDTNGLPHHISTESELETYYAQFKKFLTQLPHPPILVTMACSAEDDYCPRSQMSCIQEKVVQILRDVFGDKVHEKPILHYMDDEWDVMQL